MALVSAIKTQQISQASDPKKAIVDAVGDLSGFELFSGWILLGSYIRPEKTAGGIIRPGINVDEDQWQGRVGLVLKKGPLAFQDDQNTDFAGQDVNEGDWVAFNLNDSRALQVNKTACRLIQDTKIVARVSDPEMVF